jgi:hypothetical protein
MGTKTFRLVPPQPWRHAEPTFMGRVMFMPKFQAMPGAIDGLAF